MADYKIAVLVGSLRKGSHNRVLARALEKLAAGKAVFSYVEIGDLPLYNQDFDKD
jgi:chromate reductase